jgi:translation initiation factor 2 beta subunit (eIF-2beta)/eIF-5
MFVHVCPVECCKLGSGAAETDALLQRETALSGIKPQFRLLLKRVFHTALAVDHVAKYFGFYLVNCHCTNGTNSFIHYKKE